MLAIYLRASIVQGKTQSYYHWTEFKTVQKLNTNLCSCKLEKQLFVPNGILTCLDINASLLFRDSAINTLEFRGKIKMDIRVSGYRRFWHIV